MAKADCSEWAKTITQIAMNIASRQGPGADLDSVVKGMQEHVEIDRDTVAESIVEATEKDGRNEDVIADAVNAVKQEARTDRLLNRQITTLEQILEAGEVPVVLPRATKLASDAIQQARAIRNTLKKKLAKSEPVEMERIKKQIARHEARIQKRLGEQIAQLEKAIKTGQIPVKLKRATKQASAAVQQLRTTRDILKKQFADINRAKSFEKATVASLQERITLLEQALSQGRTLEPRPKKTTRASADVQQLRALRDDLTKRVAKSEPVRKAALQKQIDKMDAIIEAGDFTPRVKPPDVGKSKELERLEFERDEKRRFINREIAKLKPQNVWTARFDKLNVARAIMTSFDLSAVFRQGGFFVFSNPRLAAKSLVPMLKATVSRQNEAAINKEIENRDNAMWYRKTKLAITDPGGKITQKEEAYQTSWAEKIPIAGPIIKASERGYTTFLNKLRADAFDTFAATLTKDGDLTLEQAQAITNFVNVSTGRGSLGKGEGLAVPLNALFFSPRLMASRFQALSGAVAPGTTFKAPAEVRKIIRAQYAKYLIGIGLMYFMASIAFEDDEEFDIEFDSRSSDFGKLRFGNTRVDPLSGMSQTIVLLSRVGAGLLPSSIVSGGFKSASTGNIRKLRGTDLGFGRDDAGDVVNDFLRNKYSPLMGAFSDVVLRGRTFGGKDGKPVTPQNVLGGFLPMTFEEVAESIQEQGLSRGSAVSLMAIMGMGVQTWGHAFETMTPKELRAELAKHTYKETGIVERQGDKVHVRRGDAHVGEEGRVKAIKTELQRRAG